MSFKEDYKYGINKEQRLKSKLERTFKTDLIKTDMFNTFDFHDVNRSIYIEVKARTCSHDRYDTTMIPMDKYQRGCAIKRRDRNISIYYIFDFVDKTLYIEHSDITFSYVRLFRRNHRYGRHDLLKRYGYIDVNDLTPLT